MVAHVFLYVKQLIIFSLSCLWLLMVFSFSLIGCCDNFDFSFKTFDQKALYPNKHIFTEKL